MNFPNKYETILKYFLDNIYEFVRKSWVSLPNKGTIINIGFTGTKERSAEVVPLTMSFAVGGNKTFTFLFSDSRKASH